MNGPLHNVVSRQQITLDSMENVLMTSNRQPDFIKVDAEGADLEILRGAQKYLQTSCLGVFAEASFAERHKGAPFFSGLDVYMRAHNFMLMDLYLERWVRANAMTHLSSRHQLIWGNTLYVLNRQEFLRRMKEVETSAKREMFIKILLILLLYQLHDYADEIVKCCELEGLINDREAA